MDNRDAAIQYWQTLNSDKNAVFDREVTLDAGDISPTVSWGITPEQSIPIDAKIPNPDELPAAQAEPIRTALEYMGLEAGQALEGTEIDQIFLGSCTNARIEDIRAAAAIIDGHRAKVPGLVSPGSTAIKQQAEQEGLDQIFIKAGLEWAASGCSSCVAMNGDTVAAGKRCASTTNRNFQTTQAQRSVC